MFQLKGTDFRQVMTELVDALRYKLEDRGFDYRYSQWVFLLTNSYRLHHSPGVESASNSNEYQQYLLFGKGGRCVGLSSLLPSCADSLAILRASTSCSPQRLCRPVQVCVASFVTARG